MTTTPRRCTAALSPVLHPGCSCGCSGGPAVAALGPCSAKAIGRSPAVCALCRRVHVCVPQGYTVYRTPPTGTIDLGGLAGPAGVGFAGERGGKVKKGEVAFAVDTPVRSGHRLRTHSSMRAVASHPTGYWGCLRRIGVVLTLFSTSRRIESSSSRRRSLAVHRPGSRPSNSLPAPLPLPLPRAMRPRPPPPRRPVRSSRWPPLRREIRRTSSRPTSVRATLNLSRRYSHCQFDAVRAHKLTAAHAAMDGFAYKSSSKSRTSSKGKWDWRYFVVSREKGMGKLRYFKDEADFDKCTDAQPPHSFACHCCSPLSVRVLRLP